MEVWASVLRALRKHNLIKKKGCFSLIVRVKMYESRRLKTENLNSTVMPVEGDFIKSPAAMRNRRGGGSRRAPNWKITRLKILNPNRRRKETV